MLNKNLNLNQNFFTDKCESKPIRDGFGEGLLEVSENKNVVVLSADLSESVKASDFAKKFPERYFEIGVAEQNMAGVGAGLALTGKIPFITSFGVFNPMRNLDQIRVSICYSNLNVKILGSHCGFSNGRDGATHQALEDVAVMRVLPNTSILCPCDSEQMKKLVSVAAKTSGPVYIRSFKESTKQITTSKTPVEFGKGQILMEGKDVCLFTSGPITVEVLEAAKILEEKHGLSSTVINIHTIKPLDKEIVLQMSKQFQKLFVVEEHQVIGGLGGAITEYLSEFNPVKIKILGVEETFGESGSYEELLKKYKLDRDSIVENVLNFS